MRAAIYARMSADKQSADSPADQITRCRDFAKARGWTVVEALVVSEAGISRASRHNRPGLLGLLARIAEWDVLLCWDSSRLARDSEDLGWIRNRLQAHKRTGYEVSTGLELSNVGSKVMGVLAEEYLVKLRADTQCGLSAGGTPYGYRTEAIPSGRLDAHGVEIPAGYRLVIHEAEAAVVRRLFKLYASGEGLREIARTLNREGIPSPRARAMKGRAASWAPSALRAMLLNPIYRGEYVWNRSEWVKDHESGRRRRFERPEAEWVRHELAEARIVDPDLWDWVQTVRRAKRSIYITAPGGGLVTTRAGAGIGQGGAATSYRASSSARSAAGVSSPYRAGRSWDVAGIGIAARRCAGTRCGSERAGVAGARSHLRASPSP